jgi:RimJ/RimL family protein N-acetyltransferase
VAGPAVPVAEPIRSDRLDLEPLRIDHAPEAARLFDDEGLHRYTGGVPATEEELRRRYGRQAEGSSPDGSEAWLNWMLRHRGTGQLLGTVQATVRRDGDGTPVAELAWVVASAQQGKGYGREAAAAMTAWLQGQGVLRFTAHIHPEHRASMAVGRALGMSATQTAVDGEIRWSTD